ncbi:MAG: hypothetical protein WD468_02780 [Pirellulales bacterium]
MPGCILHAEGASFDVDAFLAAASLEPYWVWRRGEQVAPVGPRSLRSHVLSGFRCDVSGVDGDLTSQIYEAIAFANRYRTDLEALANNAAVKDRYLDFGYDCLLGQPGVNVHCEILPWEFLQLMGQLRISVWLSLYAPTIGDPHEG